MKTIVVFAAILAVCLAEVQSQAEETKDIQSSPKDKRGIFSSGYGYPYYGHYDYGYPYHGFGYGYHAPIYSKPIVSYHAPIISKSYVLPSYHYPSYKSYLPYHGHYW